MEERGAESSLVVADPFPSRPPGEESPPQQAVEGGCPTECHEVERKGETGGFSGPQGSSPALQPAGSDAGAPEVAALEHVANVVSAASGDAGEQAAPVDMEEVHDSLNPRFEQAAESGEAEAEASVPQGFGAASASCVDGCDQKTIAFEADAGNTAVGDAVLLKEQALGMSMEETENTLIPQSQEEKNGGQEEVLMPRSLSAVSPSASDGGIQESTALKFDTTAIITGDAAASAAEEEISKMDVDGAPISQWQKGKDSEQGEVLMPQSSSAVFPSASNDVLLKFETVESASTAMTIVDNDAAEVAVSKMDAVIDNDAVEVVVSKMNANNVPIKQVICGEVDVSMSKCSTSSPSSFDGLEKVAACEHDAVATSCDDDDALKEEAAFADVNNLDSLPLSLSEQMEDVKDPEILVHKGSLSELPSDSDRGVQNISAIEPDTAAISEESPDAIDDEPIQMDVEVDETRAIVRRGGGRRKRGRPAKSQVARTASRRKEEEEVCFICFDGGDLVVCDRRGCPKVYHPSCVNRNEAFFRAKGKWSCGWHICSICERSARYMCFTCTHSLCRGCFKNSGFVCVRGYKGFCETCMSTVMLIEANEHGNETTIGVDFDDRTSFEYLFKDYWLSLKAKLSLTLEELTRAKNPVKKPDVAIGNEESSDDLHTAKEEQVVSSSSSSENKEERIASRRNLRKRSKNAAKGEGIVKDVENAGTSVSRDFDWASEELLEFVAHMKNGDRSALSQFDVQGLLLEYIKKKNLRDPRRKSQIICDARLQNLFGKERVGHFEMLKLLESHFITKEVSTLDTEDRQGGVVDPDPDPADAKGNSDSSTKITLDKKRKARKKVEKESLTNLDDYAAIDVHNISLMYLRRNLMEELIDDVSSLDETVIGSFVRIRISGVGQRQDMYRLVQVVGTSKATERYKSGKKTTDVTLEILNLNKKETITIDIISNQDFTEEECKRLRQSIKCGLIGRLTVGDVQEKARSLQAVRVNDWLESEKLRLGHLRDRASEKGRRKELRECVEKLQLLSTPEERQRRLHEIPEIHADPHMDPDYESAEEEEESDLRKKDYYSRLRGSSFLRNGREVRSPGKGGSALSDSWVSLRKNSNSWESNRGSLIEGASVADSSAGRSVDTNEFSLNQANDIRQTNCPETPRNHVLASVPDVGLHNEKQHKMRLEQSSDGPQGTQRTSLPGGREVAATNISESDKIWHYKDPSGKIQGPFSMAQLRKWSTTGYFPPNLKIWRTSEKQEDSILLTDALVGKFEKDLPEWVPPKTTPQSMVVSPTVLSAEKNSGVWRGSNESASANSRQNAQKWGVGQSEKWASSGEKISPKEVDVKFAQEQGTNTTLVSQPSGQYHENLSPNSISHRLPSSVLKVPPVNDSSYHWRNDSSTMPTPTQPISKGWSSEEGSDKHMPSAPVQDMNSGWINMARGKEEPDSAFSVDEPTRITSNSFRELGSGSARYVLDQTVISDGGKSLPVASLSAADSVSLGQSMASTQHQNKIDAMSNFQIRNYELDSLSNVENQRSLILPLKDEIKQQSNRSLETKMILTQEQAASCHLEDNQNDPCLSHNQHNPERPVCQLDSNVLSENLRERTTVSEMENLTAAVGSKFVQADLERNPAGLAGSLDKNIYQTSAVAYPEYNLVPEKVSSEAPNLGIRSNDVATNLPFQPDVSESSSAQRLQGHIAPNLEPCVTGSEPMHSANFEVTMHMKSNNNPNQSAQQMTPYGWNSVPGSASVNNENVKLLSSDGSNPPFPSQFGGNAAIAPVQQTQLGYGSGANIQNTSFAVAPQNLGPNPGPVQGTGNMNWIPAPQGNMNTGWGMVSQGNMSMSWGQPAQTIGNMNMSLGAPNQVNMMNSGWVAPAQGNANMSVGWVTPAMANTNQTPGWGGQLQGNFPVNPVWAMIVPGQTNPGPGPAAAPSPGWVAQVPPNAQQNWETPNQGNMNMNAAWGSGQGNVNPPMNPSAGNPPSLNSQPPPSGDRHSSQSDNAWVNDSGQSNRWPSWNRVQLGGGSSAPPRGQTGICKFYEVGYCKKGASCNYFHP